MDGQSGRIRWNDSFALGDPQIDAEHRRLVNILNDLADAVENGRGDSVLGSILTRLRQYAAHHFSNEEAFMERVGFTELERHRKLHAELSLTVTEYLRRFESGARIRPVEILNFLSDWLVDHIQREDRKAHDQVKPAAPDTPE